MRGKAKRSSREELFPHGLPRRARSNDRSRRTTSSGSRPRSKPARAFGSWHLAEPARRPCATPRSRACATGVGTRLRCDLMRPGRRHRSLAQALARARCCACRPLRSNGRSRRCAAGWAAPERPTARRDARCDLGDGVRIAFGPKGQQLDPSLGRSAEAFALPQRLAEKDGSAGRPLHRRAAGARRPGGAVW